MPCADMPPLHAPLQTEGPSPRPDSFRAFLDTQQYSAAGILKYERVFGDGFVSTGGLQTTEELVKLLELQKGQVGGAGGVGCGVGVRCMMWVGVGGV
jgi:hypothetical protein